MARKICTACGKRLSATAFNHSTKSADGLARICRACANARRRERERSADTPPSPRSRGAALAEALRKGDVQTLKKFLRAGPLPHWSAVCETMREGHFAVAELLLEVGVERNVFTMAAMGDVNSLTRRLRRVPADARLVASFEPASDRVTALHVGCASEWRSQGAKWMTAQVQAAEVLVEYGADLHTPARYRGIEDATALYCACWTSGNVALVRWLLDRGAVPGTVCLSAALGHLQRHGRGAYDVAECLVERGVPVNGGPRGTLTLLQAFAHQSDHRGVAWLLAHGAKVNARGPGGRTAAHFACERNTGPRTLALLVEHGADLEARDDDGRTPLDLARLHNKPRVVEWIAQRLRAKRR